MNPFDGTPARSLSGACVRAINKDYSCVIGRDRNRAMAPIPSNAEVDRVIKHPRPSCGGKSILEMIWDELMAVYKQLKEADWIRQEIEDHPADHDDPDSNLQTASMSGADLRGQALGFATAIAILVNPYAPNVDAVRAEAASRWEAR